MQNTLITVTYFIDKKELSEATADEARRRIENVVSDELKIRGVGSAQLSKITQTIESREHKIILDVISDPDLMPKIIREFLK